MPTVIMSSSRSVVNGRLNFKSVRVGPGGFVVDGPIIPSMTGQIARAAKRLLAERGIEQAAALVDYPACGAPNPSSSKLVACSVVASAPTSSHSSSSLSKWSSAEVR